MFIKIDQDRQKVFYQMKHYNVSGCDRDAYKIPPPALKVAVYMVSANREPKRLNKTLLMLRLL